MLQKSAERSHISDVGASDAVIQFEDMLLARSRDRSLSKRERTRFLILTIVARCIQKDPSRDPTVESVLDQSGLARSTFYSNFKDIQECAFEVLFFFFEYLGRSRSTSARHLTLQDAIVETNSWYCRAYEANAGLFAAVSRNLKVLRLREVQNANWTKKVVYVAERRRGCRYTKKERKEIEGLIRILITMTVDTARERFVVKDKLLGASYPTADALAIALSTIWRKVMAEYENRPSQESSTEIQHGTIGNRTL